VVVVPAVGRVGGLVKPVPIFEREVAVDEVFETPIELLGEWVVVFVVDVVVGRFGAAEAAEGFVGGTFSNFERAAATAPAAFFGVVSAG
jgi:hypothetical protein